MGTCFANPLTSGAQSIWRSITSNIKPQSTDRHFSKETKYYSLNKHMIKCLTSLLRQTQVKTTAKHWRDAPWVKRVLGKHEDPGLEPRDPHKGLVSVIPALTLQMGGAGRSPTSLQVYVLKQARMWRPVLKVVLCSPYPTPHMPHGRHVIRIPYTEDLNTTVRTVHTH